jgi:hypothetical protein
LLVYEPTSVVWTVLCEWARPARPSASTETMVAPTAVRHGTNCELNCMS